MMSEHEKRAKRKVWLEENIKVIKARIGELKAVETFRHFGDKRFHDEMVEFSQAFLKELELEFQSIHTFQAKI